MKPLPKETYLVPGDDLHMHIAINASITSTDEITLSLGHSSKGIYEDLTNYLVYKISEKEDEFDEGEDDSRLWNIDMQLPYPYSQSSGDLTLSVGDSLSGEITTTQLIIRQEEDNVAPFFDPAPRSVDSYPGEDVLINAEAMSSSPFHVSVILSKFVRNLPGRSRD